MLSSVNSLQEIVVVEANGVQKLKVFVSYSRKDEVFAGDLVAALDACGFAPYLDKQDVAPGEPWEQRLSALIQQADTVVFVISPDSIGSQRCAWEVEETKRLSKRLLPVVWRSVPETEVPSSLKLLNFIFFDKTNSFGISLAQLARALNVDLNWIREHTRLAELAARWNARRRPEVLLLRGQDINDAKDWLSNRPKDAPEPTLLHREFIAESDKAEAALARRETEREARTRRLRWAVSSSVFGLLTFVGIAGFAARQSSLADEHRNRSIEIAYGFVEATASISDRLGVPVRATLILLKQSEQTLDQIAASGGESANLKHRRAQVMIQVAHTYAQAGKSDEHLSSARKATEILEQLVRAAPDNLQYSNDLASAKGEIGNAYRARGDLSSAQESYSSALLIRGRLTGMDPGDYSRIGEALMAQGKLDEALKSYREGLSIAERLAKADPTNAGSQRDLSVSYSRIGEALMTQGKLDEALKSFRESLFIAERLAKADPGNAGWQSDLSVSYSRIGEALMTQGNLDEALKSYREGLSIAERLAAADPTNADWQGYLGTQLRQLAKLQIAMGLRDEALATYQQAKSIVDRLVTLDPTNSVWIRDQKEIQTEIFRLRSEPAKRRL
jgi:tetratricopeptide (TPR) repeat protein